MSYTTPKYGSVPIGEFRLAMVDIRMYNAVSDMIGKFIENMDNYLEKEVYDIANGVVLEAKLNYVPVRTGRLRASGYTEMPNVPMHDVIEVDFGFHAPYAHVVHETHPTKSKFLEKPTDEMVMSGMIEERLARVVLQLAGF